MPQSDACDFDAWAKKLQKERPGQPAAMAILECVRAACTLPTFQAGAKREQELFIPLIKVNGLYDILYGLPNRKYSSRSSR